MAGPDEEKKKNERFDPYGRDAQRRRKRPRRGAHSVVNKKSVPRVRFPGVGIVLGSAHDPPARPPDEKKEPNDAVYAELLKHFTKEEITVAGNDYSVNCSRKEKGNAQICISRDTPLATLKMILK